MRFQCFFGIFFLLALNAMAGEAPGVRITIHLNLDIKVIVAANSNTVSLTRKEISDIFLKKMTRWTDHSAITPFDLKYDNAVRAIFSKQIHGRSPSFIKKYWQQQIFGGYELPPLEKEVSEVILAVAGTRGGIGYVPADLELPASVKAIDIRE